MQQRSRKASSGTWLRTYLVGSVQSSAHFHSSQGNPSAGRFSSHPEPGRGLAWLPGPAQNTGQAFPRKQGWPKQRERVHMQGWACGELGWPCLGTDSSFSSNLFSWAEVVQMLLKTKTQQNLTLASPAAAPALSTEYQGTRTFLWTTEEVELMVLSSLCIMTSSGLLSSRTSCTLLTLLLWLPVLTDMLGMEWLLPRLSIFLLRFDPCSLSYKTRGISYRSCRTSPAQHVPAMPRVCFKGDSADFKGL